MLESVRGLACVGVGHVEEVPGGGEVEEGLDDAVDGGEVLSRIGQQEVRRGR